MTAPSPGTTSGAVAQAPPGPGKAGRGMGEVLTRRGITVGVVVAILVAWWAVTRLGLVTPVFVPTPAATWQAFLDTMSDGYQGHLLITHLLISLRRVAIAFVLAVVVAVPLGVLVGASRRLEAALDPLVNFYRVLPPLAYYTILVIWLGIGESSKVTLLFLAGFPAIFIAVIDGVRGISTDRVNAAKSLGASNGQVLRHVVLPSLLPSVFTGMRVALGFTYTTVVAAEMVAATSGIGWMVLDASRYLKSDVIFMGIIVMGITGVLLDAVVRYAGRRLVPWQGRD